MRFDCAGSHKVLVASIRHPGIPWQLDPFFDQAQHQVVIPPWGSVGRTTRKGAKSVQNGVEAY
jgi:hypothetical protein